jgi:hypothetical protein
MLYKTTRKLFRDKYKYKIVIICAGSHWFRSNNLDDALDRLKEIELDNFNYKSSTIKTKDDLDFAFKLHNALSSCDEVDIRVETPWISIYSNNKKDIDRLAKLDKDKVKYISIPAANTGLDKDTVVMPKMNYDYRITLGKTIQEHSAFINWANANKKCKLTKSCTSALLRPRSWGGQHFYITGDNNLLMAKMHLGSSIAKVERIVKA